MHDLNFVSAKQGQPLRCACGLLPSSDLIRHVLWTKLDRVGTSNVVVYNFDDVFVTMLLLLFPAGHCCTGRSPTTASAEAQITKI